MNIQRISFEVGTLTARQYLSREVVLQHAKLTSLQDEITQQLVYELTMKVAQCEKIETQDPISYPADWWEAVKARWAPAWWRRQYPVKMITIFRRTIRICPHLEIPPGRSHLQWLNANQDVEQAIP